MDAITRHCSACGAERLFEQPPCLDGHGDDCPEWACAECGSAILIDPYLREPFSVTADPAAADGGRSLGHAPSQAA